MASDSNLLKDNHRRRFESIDALRGLAALSVVFFHLTQQFGGSLPWWIRIPALQGSRGVQLFYVISAFTLFNSLAERQTRGGGSTREFFIRRFFRIAPLYYVALIFYLWLYGTGPRYALGSEKSVTLTNIISHLFFLNGFYPYWINSIIPVEWSVTVEMTFYCLIPILFRWITSLRRALFFACGTLVFYSLIQTWAWDLSPVTDGRIWHEYLSYWIVSQLPIFSFGFILYFLLKKDVPIVVRTKIPILICLSLVLSIALAFQNPLHIPRHMLYGILFVGLAFGLTLSPTKILVNRFTVFCGTLSYSIYLVHIAAVRLAVTLLGERNQRMDLFSEFIPLVALSLLFTLGFSWITFRLIEIPGQRVGSNLIKYFRSQKLVENSRS